MQKTDQTPKLAPYLTQKNVSENGSPFYFALRKALLAALFSVMCMSPVATHAMPKNFFNMEEDFTADITPFPKWTSMLSRYSNQQSIPDAACGQARFHPCIIKDWRATLRVIQDAPLQKQMAVINDYGNAFPYIIDQINWGLEDFWTTPFEFFSVNGDCEDYAIAKYYSLRALGVPSERLRIMIVQDFNLGGTIHAILGVYEGNNLWILDNQIKQLIRARDIYHYRPVFGINEDGWWAYYPHG